MLHSRKIIRIQFDRIQYRMCEVDDTLYSNIWRTWRIQMGCMPTVLTARMCLVSFSRSFTRYVPLC